MDNPHLKAAIYTRVSTEDQAKEGFSLDSQMERLKNYCQAREWEIYKEFIDDGFSGRYIKRPAYQSLMDNIDNWDVLLVLKMDRIHRNSRNFMEMMDVLRNHNKEFVSMTESLDTSTAMGRFVMDIIQRIAQLESEQIGERVYAGMKQKANTPIDKLDPERSPYLGFNAPYGYDFIDENLVINKTDAKLIQEMFESYANGKTVASIAKNLNKMGITTKRGKKWTVWSVGYILKNPIYEGNVKWDGYIKRGNHKPIIDASLFDRVQNRLKIRSNRKVSKMHYAK